MLPIYLWVWAIHWCYRGHILKGNCLSLSEAKLSEDWHFKSTLRCFLPHEGKKVLRIKHYVSRENLLNSYKYSWARVVLSNGDFKVSLAYTVLGPSRVL